jgi:DNA-binding NtrC family response regulator
MPKTPAAQLQREIAEALKDKPICAGINTSGITAAPLTDAKRLSAAEFERCYLSSVLERAGGSISEAARIAGLDRTNFRRLLHRHGLRSRTGE